jgi:uncharacterized protein
MKPLLMLFVKNPVLGKVKARLAVSIGAEMALEIYQRLLFYTAKITASVSVPKLVFYSDFIPESDNSFPDSYFQKTLQKGENLGERMKNAFASTFAEGFEPVIIIGSDCPQITPDILLKAFESLAQNDAVIGPATDGGYYLLGMKRLIPEVFEHKSWSTDTVLPDTLADLDKLRLTYTLLPTLSDIDEEKDLALLA